jgi:hypothetical protein
VRRAGHSSRGVLLSVVCLKCDYEASNNEAALGPQGAVEPLKKRYISGFNN